MLINFLGTVLFIIILWMIGLAILKLTGELIFKYSFAHFISIPVGLTVCSIVATIMYFRFNASVAEIRIAYGVLALLALAALIRKKTTIRECSSLGISLLLFCIMILPGVFRGEKYYVYRGNIWDQYFYLCEVVYMGLHKLSIGTNGFQGVENVADVIQTGFGAINSDRPTAPLLCAVLTSKGVGSLYFQAYLYLTAVWSGVFGSMMLVLQMFSGMMKKKISKRKETIWIAALSIAYVWGFYGQIQYDIDAWSQLTAIAPLLAVTCIYFSNFIAVVNENRQIKPGQYLLLFLTGTGCFIIYPENTIIYGFILAISSLIACILLRKKVPFRTLALVVSLPILILVVAILANGNFLQFVLNQIRTSGSDNRQGWASYFDQYWLGYHKFLAGSLGKEFIKKVAAFFPSIFGMFILTPNYEIRILPITMLWLAFCLLIGIGTLLLLGKTVRTVSSVLRKSEQEQEGLFSLSAFVGLALFLIMMLGSKYWSAGKLLLYISPFIYLIFANPIMIIFRYSDHQKNKVKNRKRRLKKQERNKLKMVPRYYVLAVSAIFIGCQFFFAGMRIADAVINQDATGHLHNYPSDQYPNLKQSYAYDFDPNQYLTEEKVAIAVDNTWLQLYMKLSLAFEGISYYAIPDFVFESAQLKENQPMLQEGDVIITLDE